MFGLLDWRRHRRRRNRRRVGVAGLRLWLSSVWLRLWLSGVRLRLFGVQLRLSGVQLRFCLLWVRAATLLCAPLLPLLSHLNTIRRFCRPEATPHCGYSITDLDPGLDSGLWPLGSLRGGHARKHGYCHAWRDRLGDGSPLCRIDAPNRHRLSRARRGHGRHDWRQHRLPDRSFDWDSLGRAIRQIRPAQRAAAKGGPVFVSAARRKDCLLREVRRLSSDLRGSPRGCKPYELASFPDHERPRRNLLGLTVRRRRLPVR